MTRLSYPGYADPEDQTTLEAVSRSTGTTVGSNKVIHASQTRDGGWKTTVERNDQNQYTHNATITFNNLRCNGMESMRDFLKEATKHYILYSDSRDKDSDGNQRYYMCQIVSKELQFKKVTSDKWSISVEFRRWRHTIGEE